MKKIFPRLTLLDPVRYILVIVRGVLLRGVGFEILWAQFAALGILGTAILAISVSRFSKTAA